MAFSPRVFVCLQRLSELYYDIHRSYLKVTEVVNSEKRLFGRYYRVAFYGQVSLSHVIKGPYSILPWQLCCVTHNKGLKTLSEAWGMDGYKDAPQTSFVKFLCLLFSCL